MKSAATPHINANLGDFAPTVLMPGDPKRSRFIAENFLEGARLVNDVRGVQGYTGSYLGKPVSVMASGMGMPSIAIYSHELYNFFGVENIIRVGSIGGMAEHVKLRDVIIAQAASTDSAFAAQFGIRGSFAPTASFELLEAAVREARAIGASYKVGGVLSSDVFYNADPAANEKWIKMGVLGVEMEAAALYMNAAYAGKRALAICTVSDHVVTGESTTAKEREQSFTDMIEIALRVGAKN